jgi:hypothetical protein
MPLDAHKEGMIKKTVIKINSITQGAAVQHTCSSQKLILPSFFNDHGNVLAVEDSVILVSAQKSSGLFTFDSLAGDPRETNWRQVT